MKSVLLAVVLSFGGLFSTFSFACENGDTSKIFLVLAKTPVGDKNLVIGEVRTSDDKVTITRNWYQLIGVDGNIITVKASFGRTYKFDLRNAKEAGFCSKATFGE